MSLSAKTIDRIVENVLNQIGAKGTASTVPPPFSPPRPVSQTAPISQVSLPAAVVTAELIQAVPESSLVAVRPRAIITPAAWDAIRQRDIRLERGIAESTASHSANSHSSASVTAQSDVSTPLLIIVHRTPAVRQLEAQLDGNWKREMKGCPDDAAKLAISELSRGAVPGVVIMAEQSHRAACLSNRHEQVKAVAIHDAGEVKIIRKQLRANVWCINPQNRSYFELRNLIQQIQASSQKR